jgi:hypothetical protein
MKNMKTVLSLAVLLLLAVAVYSQSIQGNQSISMHGWTSWGGIRVSAQGNSVTFNGTVVAAGYVTESINPNMRGRRIILEVQNASTSVFSEDRMLKITINREEQVIFPENVMQLIGGEYIPSSYERIEFILPDNFAGRLNLVFYQATLNDLRITMWYR